VLVEDLMVFEIWGLVSNSFGARVEY